MESLTSPPLLVVLLSPNVIYTDLLRAAFLQLRPQAMVRSATRISAADSILQERKPNLLVTALTFPDGDAIDSIYRWAVSQTLAEKTLVMLERHDERSLCCLFDLPIHGALDSECDDLNTFFGALEAILAGKAHWSPSILGRMERFHRDSLSTGRKLTETEQVVLAEIGDGSDDLIVAEKLSISPRTVATFRRNIYRKLRVQHRGELVRAALQLGFVRVTPESIFRPGYAMAKLATRTSKAHL